MSVQVKKSDLMLARIYNQYKSTVSETVEITDEEAETLGFKEPDQEPGQEDPTPDPGEDPEIIAYAMTTKGQNSMFSVGDIMVYDKTANKLKFRTYDNYDNTDTNLQPIAVCVIPDNMFSDVFARWMYIDELNVNGKTKFAWDKTCTFDPNKGYISENGYLKPLYESNGDNGAFFPILNGTNDYVVNAEIQRWEDIGILPIDDGPFRNAPFVNTVSDETDPESLIDPGCHYVAGHAYGSSNPDLHPNFVPSPYIMQLGYYDFNNDIYRMTAPSGTPANNALYFIQGFRNTWWMVTSEHAEDYEAAMACQDFKTPLMNTFHRNDEYNCEYGGSWYIPGAPEAACMIARINTINASIVKCGGTPIAYDTIETTNTTGLSGDQLIYTKYWTSTEASSNNAVCIEGFWRNSNTPAGHKVGGQIGNGFKYWELAVRPFTLTYFNTNRNELTNPCSHYGTNNKYELLSNVGIFDMSDFQ